MCMFICLQQVHPLNYSVWHAPFMQITEWSALYVCKMMCIFLAVSVCDSVCLCVYARATRESINWVFMCLSRVFLCISYSLFTTLHQATFCMCALAYSLRLWKIEKMKIKKNNQREKKGNYCVCFANAVTSNLAEWTKHNAMHLVRRSIRSQEQRQEKKNITKHRNIYTQMALKSNNLAEPSN